MPRRGQIYLGRRPYCWKKRKKVCRCIDRGVHLTAAPNTRERERESKLTMSESFHEFEVQNTMQPVQRPLRAFLKRSSYSHITECSMLDESPMLNPTPNHRLPIFLSQTLTITVLYSMFDYFRTQVEVKSCNICLCLPYLI